MLADILRLRVSDIMWRKERLLNLAMATLPRACTKITWLDCGLLFVGLSWFECRAAALEDLSVPQPFETGVPLLPGQIQFCGQGECNGDHLMAHALAGDMGSPCADRAFGRASRSRNRPKSWWGVMRRAQ
jgi:hypothetical protein